MQRCLQKGDIRALALPSRVQWTAQAVPRKPSWLKVSQIRLHPFGYRPSGEERRLILLC